MAALDDTRAVYQTLIDWLAERDFYAGDVTVDDIGAAQWRRADALARLAGAGPHAVLELGAGGGYTAAALAERGHHVTAVEWIPQAAESIRRWAEAVRFGSLRALEGDFYELPLAERFDVVCYFDGFGIGTDDDQRRLLRRIAGWLEPDGCALIDVMTPWYWAARAGEEDEFAGLRGRFGFDGDACALRYRQWPPDHEDEAVTQVIRCYSPADLRLLLEGTGLRLATFEPYESERYARAAPLAKAMIYLAQLVPAS